MPRTSRCCASSARNCKTLVAVGACAINGGLPAQRNRLPLRPLYLEARSTAGRDPDDPELPLLLDTCTPSTRW